MRLWSTGYDATLPLSKSGFDLPPAAPRKEHRAQSDLVGGRLHHLRFLCRRLTRAVVLRRLEVPRDLAREQRAANDGLPHCRHARLHRVQRCLGCGCPCQLVETLAAWSTSTTELTGRRICRNIRLFWRTFAGRGFFTSSERCDVCQDHRSRWMANSAIGVLEEHVDAKERRACRALARYKDRRAGRRPIAPGADPDSLYLGDLERFGCTVVVGESLLASSSRDSWAETLIGIARYPGRLRRTDSA
jgi:hypothetical protein